MQPEKRRWTAWIEPWYLVNAIMGVVVGGLLPVLVPLLVSQSGDAGQVGLVVAALSLGGLSAPLWGGLADRLRLHRVLLAGGLLFAALGLAAFVLTTQAALWVLLAGLAGLGTASAGTVINLFVVEAHPEPEWDQRIGWLQTFYGLGQVAGLLLAGLFAKLDLQAGLWASAGLSGVAAVLAWLTTRTPLPRSGAQPVLRHPARHAEMAISSPQRLFHRPQWLGLEALGRTLRSPFGIFLIAWLLTFTGSAVVFSQYPLLMQKVFGVTPATSSVAFAIIAGLGLSLYNPAGVGSKRYGPGRILKVSMAIRLAAFAGMFGLAFSSAGGIAGWLALFAFGFVVWAWSLMSVSGTALAAELSPHGEGQGLGVFNAINALAGILGALLGGWAASAWGYSSLLALAILGVALGLGISFMVKQKVRKH